jgi:tRNA pseudouridine55 synthase
MDGPVQHDDGNRKHLEAGVFLVDKPCGPSSFKMVQIIRRALGIKKVGHSGTLDPFASGLLVICAGRAATKLIPRLMDGEKEYHAVLRLGVETDTQDTEGRIIAKRPVPTLQQEEIHSCLAGFMGKQLQKPPMFSALKYKGKPLYYYARQGVEIERQPRTVEIKELECLEFDESSLTIRVLCSKGTYIRTLAADIGEKLGCGAHLVALRRTKNGSFDVRDSLSGEELMAASFGDRKVLLMSHHKSVDTVLEMLGESV